MPISRIPNNRPKPTALRVIQGNPGRRPYNEKEPKPRLGIPPCPKFLNKAARAEWRRVTPLLHEVGLLAQIDRAALAAYCQAWGRWVETEQLLSKTGTLVKSPNGYPMPHPLLAIANKAMMQMRALLLEFGMSPSSRSRLTSGEPNKIDPFDELLTG
jgi:P27 family predicted phage terminase small subunit